MIIENTNHFDTRPETWSWEDNDDFTFTTFPHPVEFYINSLILTGFKIQNMHELIVPHAQPDNEEEKLEMVLPRYLVIKALKTK